VEHDGHIDLPATLERLRTSQAFYQSQLNQAYKFKIQTRADYSDFTDRFDEYARSHREWTAAISHVEKIMASMD